MVSTSSEMEELKNNAKIMEDNFETDFQIRKPLSTVKKHVCGQTDNKNVESFICVVCRSDLTNFNLEERTVHMNRCIDSNSSADSNVNLVVSEAFILECPLCFKNFPSPEVRSSHIKKCGKSKGLSIQSVIQALQLQEKHVLERRALGLPLHKVKQPKKAVGKKFMIEPKNAMQSDLQLAKALSLSLKDDENQNQIGTVSSVRSSDDLSVRLEPPTESQIPGRPISVKRRKLNHTPLLLLRTEEERDKIILDKVNAIIAPLIVDEIENDVASKEDNTLDQDCTNNVTFLWDLSSKAENKSLYYVEQLADWITLSDVAAGSKICNLSQIPGHHIYTQLPCEYTFSNNDCESSSESNEPSSPLISSLKSLIGNSWMSDVDIHTASGIVIPAHKLLLAIRCPLLKNEFDLSMKMERHVLNWENTSFDAALHFLNFIYTGSTEWKEEVVEELSALAEKYNVTDLLNILNSDCETLELMCIENSQVERNSFEIKKDNSLQENIGEMNVSPASCSHQEISFSSPVESCNAASSSKLNVLNQSDSIDNQSSIETEAISVCDDILKSLKININSPNYLESESNVILSGESEHKTHMLNNNEETCYLNKVDKTDDIENSSSNDSCKILYVNNNMSLEQESSQICSPYKCRTKTTVSKLETMKISPVKTFLASNLYDGVICDEKETKIETENVGLDCLKHSSSSQSNYISNAFGTGKFHESQKDMLSPNKTKLNVPISSPIKASHTGSIRNISLFSNDSVYDCNAVESGCFALDQNDEDLENRDIRSPEIFICDSDEELNIHSNSYASYETEKSEKSTHAVTNVKSNLSVPDIVSCVSDEEEEINKVLSLNNVDSYILSKYTDFTMHNSNDKELMEINENVCDSKNSFLQNKLTINSSNPEVIHCDSDEENILNKTLPLNESHMNDFVPKYTEFDDKNEIAQLINDPCNKLVENSSSTENIKMFKSKSEVLNHRVSPCANAEKRTDLLQIVSPDSPWHFKKKTSLEDFKTPNDFLKISEKSYCDVDDVLVDTKLKKSKHFSSKKENKTKSKCNSNLSTPTSVHHQFKLSDSPVTPLPDFKSMVTPEIKEALRKIGVKALPRKKAVAVLSHVYEETHPWIGKMTHMESHLNTQPECKLPLKKNSKSTAQKRKGMNEISEGSTSKSSKSSIASPTKKLSEDNSFSSPDSHAKGSNSNEYSFSSDFSDNSQPENKEKTQHVSDFILNNEEVYKQILSYTPVNLAKFQEELKNNGISISVKGLMDFFDEQCITFHYPRKEEYKKKQQLRTQRFRKRMIAKLSQQTQSKKS